MTELLILSTLFLLNGFFALAEIALVSAKKARLEQLSSKGNRGADIALQLQENSEDFLSAIQVGITLIGIITGAYGGANLADDIAPLFEKVTWLAPYANAIAISIAIMFITYLSIIIGELVPKTLALSNPESMACRVAPFINRFSKILYPFVKFLAGSTHFIIRLLGIKKADDRISETELRQMIKTATNDGVLEDYENMMHEKVFYFSDKKAIHLMTHRSEINVIDLNYKHSHIKKIIDKSPYNKVLCTENSYEKILGILYLKDYYKAVSLGKDFDIKNLVQKPLIVHERMHAYKVLSLMRKNRCNASVVVDEYGDLQGIITLYDIMSNLVGEIYEEGETDEPDVLVRHDGSILIEGDAPIEILAEILDSFSIDFNEIAYATIAGFILDQLSHIPQVGEKFDFNKWTFEVVDLDGPKIDKVLIYKTNTVANNKPD